MQKLKKNNFFQIITCYVQLKYSFFTLYCMKTKNYSHTYINLSKSYQSPNTVKIPESYRNFISLKIEKNTSFNLYIHILIKKYKHLILDGKIKPYKGVKTLYQDKGLNLFSKKFRNYDVSDWSVLKILSNCLNVSRCKLVVMLIEFDMAGIERSTVATQSSTNFGFKELFIPQRQLLIRTKINIPISKGIKFVKS